MLGTFRFRTAALADAGGVAFVGCAGAGDSRLPLTRTDGDGGPHEYWCACNSGGNSDRCPGDPRPANTRAHNAP